ncbi:hypothetical protein [Microscilla marina]|uniref:Uncharacterized protein n=1 Tax=Microscilla marina ATCC 23134 TaxID=313606 RepID=A1ZE77_MICM2|nr:hypothetical protein [Microscilla marina]EAY31385.1 hypothetical protein M23134_04218 [Microscilla marina ATCC 23134]
MNNPIERPSNALWQQQWQCQNAPRFDENFWKAYERLIRRAKAVQNEPKDSTLIKPEDKITQLLTKYWTKVPKFDYAESGTRQDEPFTALVVIFGIMATTTIVLLLGNFHRMLIEMTLAIGLIFISFLPDKNSLEGENERDSQVRLETQHLVYRSQYCYGIKETTVYVPYSQIETLQQHKKGIKLVGRRGEEKWADAGKVGVPEIILPSAMEGYATLCLFLNEVATYNYQQRKHLLYH